MYNFIHDLIEIVLVVHNTGEGLKRTVRCLHKTKFEISVVFQLFDERSYCNIVYKTPTYTCSVFTISTLSFSQSKEIKNVFVGLR